MQTTDPEREKVVARGAGCQLEAFQDRLDGGPPSREEPWSWYVRRRVRGLFRRIGRLATPARSPRAAPRGQFPAPALKAGDRVRVRSADEIRRTLDENGALRGCAFGAGMYAYCGRELRVVRAVERFFDEARWRMLKARNLVILEGAQCDGSSVPDTQGCDRMCFYFWRTEWLEKLG